MKNKKMLFLVLEILGLGLLVLGNIIDQNIICLLGWLVFTTTSVVWAVPKGILCTLGSIALSLIISSWIVPGSYYSGSTIISLGLMRVGLFDAMNYPLLSLQYFIQMVLFIVTVGALYGVLEKTGKYRNALEKIAKSLKGKETIFLAGIALLFTALSSVLGLNLMLFLFIPAIIAIILLMGYDKITAFLVTFASMFIGMIGSTYSLQINGYINNVISAEFSSDILTKVALLVITFVVYIIFTLGHAKKSKKKIENAENVVPFLGEKKQVKRASWPIYLVFGLLFVIIILSVTPWVDVFKIEFFKNLHETITTWTIGEHTVAAYIIGDIKEFGAWSYMEITMLTLVSSFVLGFIYKLNIKEILEGLYTGFTKTIKIALLIAFAMIIVILTAYHPFFMTITDWIISISSKFNVFLTSIVTVIGSALNIEMVYLSQSSIPFIAGKFADATNTLALITQSFYGLTMIVAPTSTMLILGLSYLEIPYLEWLKKSWKLLLEIFVVIMAIIFITILI